MAGFDYEVLIVGGGPAGLSTWLHLRKLDPALAARSAVIEKAVYPRDKLCGGGVTRTADRHLGTLGIRLDVPSVPVHTIEIRYRDRSMRWRGEKYLRIVRRHEFDRALAEASRLRGLALLEDTDFARFEPLAGGGLRVETSRGELRVRALVGADGANSMVRRAMKIDEPPRVSRLIEILTPPSAAHDLDPHKAVMDFTPIENNLQGYIWDFPCIEAGQRCWNRGIFDSRVLPEDPRADLKALFGSALAVRQIDRPPQSWSAHPVRYFSPDATFSRPAALLVGDAAGIEPWLGEGISCALSYGEVAAQELVEGVARGDLSFSGYRRRLLAHPLGRMLLLKLRIARLVYHTANARILNRIESAMPRVVFSTISRMMARHWFN